MRPFLLLILALPVYGVGNTCTLTNTTGSACATKTCTLSAITADVTHANWTGTNCDGAGYVPDRDNIILPNAYVLTHDLTRWIVGNSGVPAIGYIKSITISSGGSGYTSAPTVAFTCTSSCTQLAGASATAVISGGAVTAIYVRDPGSYTSANAPSVSLSGGGCVADCATVSIGASDFQAGGGPWALLVNGANPSTNKLIVATGSTLETRGSIGVQTASGAASAHTPIIVFQPGSAFRANSSLATGTPMYGITAGVSGLGGNRDMQADCSAGVACTFGAEVGSGPFYVGTAGQGPAWTLKNATVDACGSAASPCYIGNVVATAIGMQWQDVTLSANTGRVQINASDLGATATMLRVRLLGTLDAGGQSLNATGANGTVTGTRSLDRVYMVGRFGSASYGGTGTTAPGFVLTDLLPAGGWGVVVPTSAGWQTATLARNVVRNPTGGSGASSANTSSENYLLSYNPTNVHFAGAAEPPTYADGAVTNSIYDGPEDPGAGAYSSGEWFGISVATGKVFTFTGNLGMPTKNGKSSMKIGDMLAGGSATWALYRNTVWGGGIGGDEPTTSSQTLDMRGNIIGAPAGTFGFLKYSTEYTTSPQHDPCTGGASGTCDYNVGWNVGATDPTCVNCQNQGNGYAGWFTATPGVHDVSADPRYADIWRNIALFDTKYWNHGAAYWGAAWRGAWAATTVYAVGDVAQDSNADVYGGAPVNYRCISAHTAQATDEPNVGANWLTKWEIASFKSIGEATAAGTTITDGAIGCAACTPIQAVLNWTRKGYTPLDPSLWCAPTDATWNPSGESYGAVPFCASGKAMIGAAGL